MKAFCCEIGCQADAEFAIFARDPKTGSTVGDPMCNECHACREHVGNLLGHPPGATGDESIEWLVCPISVKGDEVKSKDECVSSH